MKIDSSFRKITGIYKITNLINKKCYVGSAVDIYNRCATYRHLFKRDKLHNRHLGSAFKKYGLENFKFELLKECPRDISINVLHQLEQKYINELRPEYNKRTIVDTNHLISHSQSTKDKISKSLKESFKNGTKIINRIQPHNIKVSLFDLRGNHIQDFPGLSHCADFLNCRSTSIGQAIKSKRKRIKNYIVLPTENSYLVKNFLDLPRLNYAKSVTVVDVVTNQTIDFPTRKECAKFIKCKVDTLKIYYENKKVWKSRYKIIKYE